MKKPTACLLLALAIFALLTGCPAPAAPAPTQIPETLQAPAPLPSAAPGAEPDLQDFTQEEMSHMNVEVNGQNFTATLEQNLATQALLELLEAGPVTLRLQDYAGFEKVGPLGQALPTSDRQTTTQPGDIVLYLGDQIVLFYGSNSWSYTRLARIDDLTGWADALGSGDVTVTLSLGE